MEKTCRFICFANAKKEDLRSSFFKRVMGIEPTCSAWKADILPLNYTRIKKSEPEGIRTPDPRLRRPLLYPAELPIHVLTQELLCHNAFCLSSLFSKFFLFFFAFLFWLLFCSFYGLFGFFISFAFLSRKKFLFIYPKSSLQIGVKYDIIICYPSILGITIYQKRR